MKIQALRILCCSGFTAVILAGGPVQAQFSPGQGQRSQPSREGPIRNPFGDIFNFPSTLFPDRPTERETFEKRFVKASPAEAVYEFEALQAKEFSRQLELSTTNQVPTAAQISVRLGQMAQETGKKPAVLYAVALKKQTHLLLVLPALGNQVQRSKTGLVATRLLTPEMLAQAVPSPVIREILPKVSRDDVVGVAKAFRKLVSDPTKLDEDRYRQTSEQLYRWIVAPLEPQLKAQGIDTLLFSMDDGLRTIPVAALNSGSQFLVERFSSALIPSFGLTSSPHRTADLTQQPLLAMGISKSTDGLAALPAVSAEISEITGQNWTGPSRSTLDETTTLAQLKTMYFQQRFGILHLATHAFFNSGRIDNSYIQLWNSRLSLSQIRRVADELQWKSGLPPLQLMVLSACQTALGNKEAELGFAGAALEAGIPTAIATLWSVNDTGTVVLMKEFYSALKSSTKADAVRQSQLQLLHGASNVHLELSQPTSDPSIAPVAPRNGDQAPFAHPYFWSGYTVVGNWN